MNLREMKYFGPDELKLYDGTSLPFFYLIKCLAVKVRRHLWGRFLDSTSRLVWTVTAVSDATGPTDNVRNYMERKTVRSILSGLSGNYPIKAAGEVACGYGRIIMVLKEFSEKVVGFEREEHLLTIARHLLPDIDFCRCESLDQIGAISERQFDFMMTNTVLQHLNDDFCGRVLAEMKKLCPEGHILLAEKTESISVSTNQTDGTQFISRARTVEAYQRYMAPFVLVSTVDMVLEPTYHNKRPGIYMLFRSPDAKPLEVKEN